jgi:hypothetical protein
MWSDADRECQAQTERDMPADLPADWKVYISTEFRKLRQIMRWELGYIDLRDPARSAVLSDEPDLDLIGIPTDVRTYFGNEKMKMIMYIRWQLGRIPGMDPPAREPPAESLSRSDVANMIAENIGSEMNKFHRAYQEDITKGYARVDERAKKNLKELENRTWQWERDISGMFRYFQNTVRQEERNHQQLRDDYLQILHKAAGDRIHNVKSALKSLPNKIAKDTYQQVRTHFDDLWEQRIPHALYMLREELSSHFETRMYTTTPDQGGAGKSPGRKTVAKGTSKDKIVPDTTTEKTGVGKSEKETSEGSSEENAAKAHDCPYTVGKDVVGKDTVRKGVVEKDTVEEDDPVFNDESFTGTVWDVLEQSSID